MTPVAPRPWQRAVEIGIHRFQKVSGESAHPVPGNGIQGREGVVLGKRYRWFQLGRHNVPGRSILYVGVAGRNRGNQDLGVERNNIQGIQWVDKDIPWSHKGRSRLEHSEFRALGSSFLSGLIGVRDRFRDQHEFLVC